MSNRLVLIAILGLTFGITFPGIQKIYRRAALHAAAGDVQSILRLARVRAVVREAGVGVRFVQLGGAWHYTLYDDGDGDGVRLQDIANGIDTAIAPPRPVLDSNVVAVDGVNEPALCAFTPQGAATPCIVSLTDGAGGYEHVTQRVAS